MEPDTSPNDPQSSGVSIHDRVDLTTTLYGELRRLAGSMMARQRDPQTLQATALLHEAWLKLGGQDGQSWENRRHYYYMVAEAMRHILVDRARRRQSKRHGGGLQRVDMDPWNWERLNPTTVEECDRAILAVNEALERLSLADRESADLVRLHYLVGLSVQEAADLLALSLRTAERRLAYARFWMGQEIEELLSA